MSRPVSSLRGENLRDAVFRLLIEAGPMTVLQIAEELRCVQQTILGVCNEMVLTHGLHKKPIYRGGMGTFTAQVLVWFRIGKPCELKLDEIDTELLRVLEKEPVTSGDCCREIPQFCNGRDRANWQGDYQRRLQRFERQGLARSTRITVSKGANTLLFWALQTPMQLPRSEPEPSDSPQTEPEESLKPLLADPKDFLTAKADKKGRLVLPLSGTTCTACGRHFPRNAVGDAPHSLLCCLYDPRHVDVTKDGFVREDGDWCRWCGDPVQPGKSFCNKFCSNSYLRDLL